MAGVTLENEKEKSGKPGFFSGLRKSILNTLSPNQFNKSQKEKRQEEDKENSEQNEDSESKEDKNGESEEENKHEVNVEKGRKRPYLPSDSDSDDGPVAGPSELIKISPNTYAKGQPPTRQNKLIQGKKQSNYREVEKVNIFPGDKETESPIIDTLLSEADFGSTYSLSEEETRKIDVSLNKTKTKQKPDPNEKVKEGGEENAKIKPLLPTATKTIKKILFQINTTARKTEKKEEPEQIETLPPQIHFDKICRSIRETGLSEEDAKISTKAVLTGKQKEFGGKSVTRPQEEEIGADNDYDNCPLPSTQMNYYNCQKLLQNQQQQTIVMLAQIPIFNGLGTTRYEDWIQHFEGVIDTSEFEEGRKIKLLRSKLFGTALDCISTFQISYPNESKSYSKIRKNLHERFHGGESRQMYLIEFNNANLNPSESIRDYAYRLQKLHSFAYPVEAGKSRDPDDVLQLRETMLMDGFRQGLNSNLRERINFKEFKTFNDLLKATERCASILNEAKLEKRFINAVTTNTNSQALQETKSKIEEMEVAIKSNRKLLRDLIQHMQDVQESLFQKEPIFPIQYDQKCIARIPEAQPIRSYQPKNIFQLEKRRNSKEILLRKRICYLCRVKGHEANVCPAK